MKKVIDGKIYSTETATHVCRVPTDVESHSPLKWHRTDLYRAPTGGYFLAGKGGPMSMWARSLEGGLGKSGGSGIQLVDIETAHEIAEKAYLDSDRMKAFGFSIEEG